MVTVVSPSRENIDDLILDSVSGRRFCSAGDLITLKKAYEEIDEIDDDIRETKEDLNLLEVELDLLKEY